MTSPIQKAEKEYSKQESEEYTLEEFLEYAKDNPNAVANSVQYLVNAIEHFGTRTVIEYGEEKERYRFFDDPVNDGEHAVLGNTEELNKFVDSLKRKASSDGENDKIIWFTGPTATGKSELKRCLLNGLQAYANTEEGRRYTLKWSLDSLSTSGMTYGDEFRGERDWYKSPVHVNPLAVLPDSVREDYLEELNEDSESYVRFDGRLDPFSRVAYDHLQDEYDSFSDIVSDDHLKVVSYIPDIGEGFGLLQSEDGGDPKQRIVGSWMQESMQEYAERGRKNAQAFTYDGVLSQGNSLVSVVEDAQHHSEVFTKLMNVCEEDIVKLDNKIAMHIDSVIICISNPDFEAALNEFEDAGSKDPQKALRRRLEKYQFRYLTSLVLETQLLIKHLTKRNVFWENEDVEELVERVSTPIEKYGTHFSPHAIEAAAYFNVLTRIEPGDIGKNNKIQYYDKGYNIVDDEKVEYDKKMVLSEADGREGLPVTYTEDILSQLAQEFEGPVMPHDVIEAMKEGLQGSPIFSDDERTDYKMEKGNVKAYISDEMRKDVLEAIIAGDDVTKDEIDSYVDSIIAWDENDEENYDAYELREFEKKYFNSASGEYGENAEPSNLIESFREDKIIQPLNRYYYENSDDGYDPENIPIEESHVLKTLLEDESWKRVEQLYPNLDYTLWENPPENSETEEVKNKAIENMKEMGYTDESAKLASTRIIRARKEVANNGT
jgi:non-specific serine/threonine protein kinase